jgi:hypothetical protein
MLCSDLAMLLAALYDNLTCETCGGETSIETFEAKEDASEGRLDADEHMIDLSRTLYCKGYSPESVDPG